MSGGGTDRGPRRALGPFAAPLAATYRAAVAVRNLAYDRGWLESVRLPVPVISVGNLTAGGTGKTPAVEWVVRRLDEIGRRPAVLLRGYGAPAGGPGGDDAPSEETLLLRENLRGVPVIADPDRGRGGREAIRRGADVCVLDDGFQHRRLARDLDLLTVDALDPFGGGHLLPWGLLREPVRNARRAHAAIVTRADLAEPAIVEVLVETLGTLLEGRPVIRAVHRPFSLLRPGGAPPGRPEELRGRRVFLACGIGNPEAFRRTVAGLGADVRGLRAFPDHHPYTGADLSSAALAAIHDGAEMLVVTQKDWMKVRSLPPPGLPIVGLRVALEPLEDPGAMEALLVQAVAGRGW
ncbi:MAG: tetraacyldisaccharide 4'-kinase [Planctomycetales bacterium]|nr:tetraacyldisaccharide 4'-kinase [Planctomycetales bacterium]